MYKKALSFIFIPLLMLSSLVSCIDINEGGGRTQEEESKALFNFATTRAVALNISYDVAKDYSVLFKVYSENPFERKDGQVMLKQNINAIAAGFTSPGGQYSERIIIPSATTVLYIYSSYIGVPHLLRIDLNGDVVYATGDNEVQPEDGLPTDRSRSYSDEIEYLSYTKWNKFGKINGSDMISVDPLSTNLIQTINKTLSENIDNSKYALVSDFYISENAEIDIRYIDGGTSAQSTFGYYIYKGNTPPANPADLNKIIIFPNASKNAKGISKNDAVKLKFYDTEKKIFVDEFPKGYTIGFFVVNNGGAELSKTNKLIAGSGIFYSTTMYNSDKRTHTAAFDLSQDGSKVRILSFEDWYDNDYNDVIYSLHATPTTALGPVPDVIPDDKETMTTVVYKGIIAFEDLWPSKGDFDLNDVVVRYESKIFIGAKDGKVEKTEDIFTLLWSGANFQDGFGYTINTARENIADIKIESGYTFAGQGLELDDNEATIILVDKAKEALTAKNTPIVFNVTTKFKNRLSVSELGASPYNPFIVANGSIGKNRKEIHLVDYKPTSKANMQFFGSKDDKSVLSANLYYRTKLNYPFAIQMPNINDVGIFLNPASEGKPIEITFPKYNDWVKSKGTSSRDWYNYPAK